MKLAVIAASLVATVLTLTAGCARRHSGSNGRVQVWIDTDPAVGERDRDVDDGLALVQALHSPELQVRGISVVFGNAPLDRALPIARRIVERTAPGLQVFGGAAGPEDLSKETDATRAMAAALGERPLTVLAIGPVTNVASVLRHHPELITRIERIVAVAGRRPGQRFTTGTTNRKGHRDFNFELDVAAFQALLDAHVPIVLAPFELSAKVWITAADLDRIDKARSDLAWLLDPARDWLQLWKNLFDVDGFNPFDTLAVAYLTSRPLLECEDLPVRIEMLPDDVTEERLQGGQTERKAYLLVSRSFTDTRRVQYCSNVDAPFKEDLLNRLASGRAGH